MDRMGWGWRDRRNLRARSLEISQPDVCREPSLVDRVDAKHATRRREVRERSSSFANGGGRGSPPLSPSHKLNPTRTSGNGWNRQQESGGMKTCPRFELQRMHSILEMSHVFDPFLCSCNAMLDVDRRSSVRLRCSYIRNFILHFSRHRPSFWQAIDTCLGLCVRKEGLRQNGVKSKRHYIRFMKRELHSGPQLKSKALNTRCT